MALMVVVIDMVYPLFFLTTKGHEGTRRKNLCAPLFLCGDYVFWQAVTKFRARFGLDGVGEGSAFIGLSQAAKSAPALCNDV